MQQHQAQRHVAAETPAVHADALRVDERLLLEPVDREQLVFDLDRA